MLTSVQVVGELFSYILSQTVDTMNLFSTTTFWQFTTAFSFVLFVDLTISAPLHGCGPVPRVQQAQFISHNGHIAESHVGDVVTYSCIGYAIPNGIPVVTCLPNGKWSVTNFACLDPNTSTTTAKRTRPSRFLFAPEVAAGSVGNAEGGAPANVGDGPSPGNAAVGARGNAAAGGPGFLANIHKAEENVEATTTTTSSTPSTTEGPFKVVTNDVYYYLYYYTDN